MADADNAFADREKTFDSSLGDYMGSWMTSLTLADIQRQRAWLAAIQAISTPDKDGNVPTIVLNSGIQVGDAKDSVTMSFPESLALMGEQFAADTATLEMDMNTSSSSVDDESYAAKEAGSGSGHFGIGGLGVTVKVSVSASESGERKRSSDYRSVTKSTLTMKRVPTPEPILRMMQGFLTIVDTEADIAKQQFINAATAKAQAAGLLPKSGDTPPPQPGG